TDQSVASLLIMIVLDAPNLSDDEGIGNTHHCRKPLMSLPIAFACDASAARRSLWPPSTVSQVSGSASMRSPFTANAKRGSWMRDSRSSSTRACWPRDEAAATGGTYMSWRTICTELWRSVHHSFLSGSPVQQAICTAANTEKTTARQRAAVAGREMPWLAATMRSVNFQTTIQAPAQNSPSTNGIRNASFLGAISVRY